MIEVFILAVIFAACAAIIHITIEYGPEIIMDAWRAAQRRKDRARQRAWLGARYAIIEAEIMRMRE